MYWIHSNSLLILYQQYYYRVWQKNPTIWLYSSEHNHWYGDVALEGTSSTTQTFQSSQSAGRYPTFSVETYFKNNNSAVVTLRIFFGHYNIIASCNNLLLWVTKKCQTNITCHQKNLQEDSLLLELFKIMKWVCQAALAFSKQKYPCIKYVWSHSAPNIASGLKFSSLKNGRFKHSIIETL
jgi:hypothetical protein